jgi:hypothetical protein
MSVLVARGTFFDARSDFMAGEARSSLLIDAAVNFLAAVSDGNDNRYAFAGI